LYNNLYEGSCKDLDIQKCASAGTMESSDVYVEIEPAKNGIEFSLESVVKEQFGEEIKVAVLDVLDKQNVKNVKIHVTDRGALECVIRARVETAVLRGKGEQ